MLVVLYFHSLGFTPRNRISLFVLRIFWNRDQCGWWLVGCTNWPQSYDANWSFDADWRVINLLVPEHMFSDLVMAHKHSGIAKDLNKMSAKSSMKSIANDRAQMAILNRCVFTGSRMH